MDFNELLNLQQKAYLEMVKKADKKEMQFLSGKDSFRGKCFGFLTSNYYKRTKLLLMGQLIYGYTFKTWSNDTSLDSPYPTWVLFSPDSYFSKDPMLYATIVDNIVQFVSQKNIAKEYKHFQTMINEPLAEPSYLMVPLFLTDNKLVYVSLVYIRPKQLPSFKSGLNIMIMNQNVSTEILYLPEKYFIDEYKKIR